MARMWPWERVLVALSRECSIQTVEVKLTCLTPFFYPNNIHNHPNLGPTSTRDVNCNWQRCTESREVDWSGWMSSLAFSESSFAAALSELLQNHEKEAAAIFYGIRNSGCCSVITADFAFVRKCFPHWVPVPFNCTGFVSWERAQNREMYARRDTAVVVWLQWSRVCSLMHWWEIRPGRFWTQSSHGLQLR